MNTRTLSAYSLAAVLGVSAAGSLSASTGAQPISQAAPVYSRDLLKSDVEGEVVVRFTITDKGEVRHPVIVSATDGALIAPTLDAVQKWKFAPATKDGVAVSVTAVQPIAFVISDLHAASPKVLVGLKPKAST